MEQTDAPLAHGELLQVEDCVWVYTAATGISNYDFEFRAVLPCRHPWQPPANVVAVARFGAVAHYDLVYRALRAEQDITLLHTPEEHLLASELPCWYPIIADITPESVWFSEPPDVAAVADQLGWPVFLKGTRQTSHHQRALAIVANRDEFERAMAAYGVDPILRWQGIVCRRYIPLRLVEDDGAADPNRLPSAFEFRTFWWKGELAGCGRYWWDVRPYSMTAAEEAGALAVAREAARRVAVPFLVVDVAQAADGHWLVIECNDGQESGYAGIAPLALWQRIVALERQGE